jgi:phosphatidylglycerol:prolipoprotein diacylglycerol transferase
MISYPNIDPIALQIGSLTIRWYGLAYIAGILLGWRWGVYLIRSSVGLKFAKSREYAETLFTDYIPWAALGIVVGGRLGQVFFYEFSYYMHHPLEILQIWKPGMSFHGGILGVIIASFIYMRKHNLLNMEAVFSFWDLLAVCTPIGLFFGRIANFINGELVGRKTDVAWAMVFPGTDGEPRHPSQLYEAFLEGVVIFCIVNFLYRYRKWHSIRVGGVMAVFGISYGFMRIFAEFFRDPDGYIGFLTMGQAYSVPLLVVGAFFLGLSNRNKNNIHES